MSNHEPFVPWMHSLLDRMKALYNKPNARTIAEALPDITGAFHYRGTKATVADLPSSGNATGDVWHITADGSEWAWDGSEWENLGGTELTVDAALSASSENPVQNKAITSKINQMVSQLGELDTWLGDKEDAPIVITVSGTTPTITPENKTIYNCGEVASLTISNPPVPGLYSIVFTSGATATVTTFPATILGLEDFAAETNTIYEINVLNNRAVIGKWAVSA